MNSRTWHFRLVLALVAIGPALAVASPPTDQCLECHRALGDTPSQLYAHDIHARHGIGCAGCHGGDASSDDPEAAMSARAGFLGKPVGDQVSAVCASCHGDSLRMASYGSRLPVGQPDMLKTSVHGKPSMAGGSRLTECTTCHGAHGIRSVRDPKSPVNPLNVVTTCTRCHADASYMRSYNLTLPVDQLEKYRTSVHGIRNKAGDPKVADCASCHGSHDIRPATDGTSRVNATNVPHTCARCHSDSLTMAPYGIPTGQFAEYARSVHGIALLEKKDAASPACNDCHGNHGATPPGIESISKVCGTCHVLNAELFASSPHKRAFDSRRSPECETCHGNHAIAHATTGMIGTAEGSVCSRCHSSTENSAGFAVADSMRRATDSLEAGIADAQALLLDAEQKGMEVSEAKFKLRDARQARQEARTTMHLFSNSRYEEIVAKGKTIAATVAQEASQQIDEYYYRRWGLGMSTLIIALLAVGVYLTLRRIERRQAAQTASK